VNQQHIGRRPFWPDARRRLPAGHVTERGAGNRLRRTLGLWHLTSIGLGGIIAIAMLAYVGLVLTGMSQYTTLNNEAPVPRAFNTVGLHWVGTVGSMAAVIGITTAMIAFTLSCVRMRFALSRDGLLPSCLSRAVRPIENGYFVARSDESAERFIAAVSSWNEKWHLSVAATRELLTRTELVIAATTSNEPVLPDDPAPLEHKHFISVGSFKPSMQELPGSVYRLAGYIVIDTVAALHEVGDVPRFLAQGLAKEADVFSYCRTRACQSRLPIA